MKLLRSEARFCAADMEVGVEEEDLDEDGEPGGSLGM